MAEPVEYVVILNGEVLVAYRDRSDARLSALECLPGNHVVIREREVGTGRWIDTPASGTGADRG